MQIAAMRCWSGSYKENISEGFAVCLKRVGVKMCTQVQVPMETRAGGTGAAIKIRPGNEGGGQACSREVRRATNPIEGEERKAESLDH